MDIIPLKKELVQGEKETLVEDNEPPGDLRIGLGWDPAAINSKYEFDLDLSCILLRTDGRIRQAEDFVFFHNLVTQSGAVKHSGDDPNGTMSTNEHDEIITIVPHQIDSDIARIVVLVTIYDGIARNQHFGMVNRSFVDIRYGNTFLQNRFNLQDAEHSGNTVINCGEIYRVDESWQFKNLSLSSREEIPQVLTRYGAKGAVRPPTKAWVENHEM